MKHAKKLFKSLSLALLLPVSAMLASSNSVQNQEADDIVRIKIIGMSDLHGNFTNYDFIRNRPAMGGLPYVGQFARRMREDTTQHVILMNGGDVLQGSMQIFYYNHVDKRPSYMPATLFNFAKVDVGVVGNHDLEVGRRTLRRFRQELNSDLLAANILYEGTPNPFFHPYTILERGGIRIAVLGLTMPIQSECVTVQAARGLEVVNMLEPARYWMNYIQTHETTDMIIGLFHAGFPYGADSLQVGDQCFWENNPLYIAKSIPGFDAIVLGHLHQTLIQRVMNKDGDSVWLVEPGFGGRNVAVLDFELQKKSGERAKILSSAVRIENVHESQKQLDPDILEMISGINVLMDRVAKEPVVVLVDTICNVDAFFGSSFFVDLIHKIQLEHTGADVSFASPLSTNVVIPPGPITFSDLFRIYRFENTLTVLSMSGREIIDYLEFAYDQWVNPMDSPQDRMLKTRYNRLGSGQFLGRQFQIPQYYFDSGAGIDYEVDVRKGLGERIKVLQMSNGEPFYEDKIYSVVVNTYRAHGAGGHMEVGAGIDQKEMRSRIISRDNTMIRELIHQKFIRQDEIMPFKLSNWRFVPESYVEVAKKREFDELLNR